MQGSSILRRALRRVEDPRFIRGKGGYLPNRSVPGALHMAAVRSPVPHGRVLSVDRDTARREPGVVGVFVADDLDIGPVTPPVRLVPNECARPSLARDVVRFAGEIVSVVVAETREQAVDAAGLVWVDIDPLPAVSNPFAAMEDDAPLVFPELGTNVIHRSKRISAPDVFDDAEVVVEGVFRNQRLAAVPLETNNALAYPVPGGLELWAGSQDVFGHRRQIAEALHMEQEDLRTRVPDMGGAFGSKLAAYPEQVLVGALARELNLPVRWEETRRENLSGMYQGRDQHQHVEIGATRDGRIVGLRATVYQNAGAYPNWGAWLPKLTVRMACGVYSIPRVDLGFVSVATHTVPTDPYRGAGRPEATAMIERSVDMLAAELDMDPVELRRRNFIDPGEFPVSTPSGALYDSGDYASALDRAVEMAGYDALRAEQAARRQTDGRKQLGIGVSVYVEMTANRRDEEWSSIEVHEDGTVTVKVGTSAHGQGHETAFAQLIAGVLNIPHTSVRLVQGDTGVITSGRGTSGSRSLQIGGSAVLKSGRAVLDKAVSVVADHYEATIDDVVLSDDGRLGIAGVPDTGLTWAEVARLMSRKPGEPGDDETRLLAEGVFEQAESSFPFGAHISVVEVDTETGSTKVLRHIAVDDCGRILNAMLVNGQVHGGVAQGYGQALLEEVVHDQDANLLTGTLVSYLIPTAGMLPSFELGRTETPSPLNPLGAKGIGESGTIGSTAAVQNAVIDAVSHLGVRHIDMPATPSTVWTALKDAGLGHG